MPYFIAFALDGMSMFSQDINKSIDEVLGSNRWAPFSYRRTPRFCEFFIVGAILVGFTHHVRYTSGVAGRCVSFVH